MAMVIASIWSSQPTIAPLFRKQREMFSLSTPPPPQWAWDPTLRQYYYISGPLMVLGDGTQIDLRTRGRVQMNVPFGQTYPATTAHGSTGPDHRAPMHTQTPHAARQVAVRQDSVDAYRLRLSDLARWLRQKFPRHSDFKIRFIDDSYTFEAPRQLTQHEKEQEVDALRWEDAN